MAINESDPSRGSGPDKVTEGASPDLGESTSGNDGAGTGKPEAARGGCLGLGWGCLPVMAGIALIPAGLFF